MLKSLVITAVSLAAFAVPAQAAVIGPDAARCAEGSGASAALVTVSGFKSRAGTIRVRAFPSNSPDLFRRDGMIRRVDVPVPASGNAEICVSLPGPGSYAFDVRHDANGNGDTDRSDGGGMSGNPSYSLWRVITRWKPPVNQVAVAIGRRPAHVPVVLNYFQDGSFGPLSRSAAR